MCSNVTGCWRQCSIIIIIIVITIIVIHLAAWQEGSQNKCVQIVNSTTQYSVDSRASIDRVGQLTASQAFRERKVSFRGNRTQNDAFFNSIPNKLSLKGDFFARQTSHTLYVYFTLIYVFQRLVPGSFIPLTFPALNAICNYQKL